MSTQQPNNAAAIMPGPSLPEQNPDVVAELAPVLAALARFLAEAAAPLIAERLTSHIGLLQTRLTCEPTVESTWLSPAEIERIYGISQRTLANWRWAGKGPPFEK